MTQVRVLVDQKAYDFGVLLFDGMKKRSLQVYVDEIVVRLKTLQKSYCLQLVSNHSFEQGILKVNIHNIDVEFVVNQSLDEIVVAIFSSDKKEGLSL